MKKRLRLFGTILLILIILTGCTFTKDRNKVIKQLKKHDVISKKWELVAETSTTTADLFIDTVSYNYIYKTKDDTYNVVRIMDNEKKYTIEVQYDVYYYTTKEKSKNSDGSVDRIEVERKFSLAKRKFGLGLIRTKLENTTKSSILLAIIAMNVDRLTSLLIRWLFWVLFGKPFAVAC